jgi:hypothetical protein
MALNAQDIGGKIITQASAIAADRWKDIADAATIELKGLAQRLVLIVEGVGTGQLSRDSAIRHFAAAKFHVIAVVAMLTVMIEAAIERIVNGALTVVRDAINAAAGFALIP